MGVRLKRPGSWVPSKVRDSKHREVLFDGNLRQMTMPFDGVNYNLVYFTRTDWHQSGDSQKVELRELGFQLHSTANTPQPTPREWGPAAGGVALKIYKLEHGLTVKRLLL